MTENLLPCPFCGSEELRISGVMGSYYVKCQECGCEQNMADGFDKAIAAWNRRTPDVVRCGECIHRFSCNRGTWFLHDSNPQRKELSFCSRGERKEAGND